MIEDENKKSTIYLLLNHECWISAVEYLLPTIKYPGGVWLCLQEKKLSLIFIEKNKMCMIADENKKLFTIWPILTGTKCEKK